MKPLGLMLRTMGAALLAALVLPCSVVGQSIPKKETSEIENVANVAALPAVCGLTRNENFRQTRWIDDIDVLARCNGTVWEQHSSGGTGFTEGAVLVASAAGTVGEHPGKLDFVDGTNGMLGVNIVPTGATLHLRDTSAADPSLALTNDASTVIHGKVSTTFGTGANRDLLLSAFRGSPPTTVNRLQLGAEGVAVGIVTIPKDLLYVRGFDNGGVTIEGFGGGMTPSVSFSMDDVTKFTIGVDHTDSDAFKIGTTAAKTSTRFKIDTAGDVTIPGTLSVAGVCIDSTPGCAAGAGELIVEGCTTFGPFSSAPSGIACDRYFDTDNAEWCCHNGTNWFECDDNVTSCS